MKMPKRFMLLLITLILTFSLVVACTDKADYKGAGTFTVESAYIREEADHLMINAEYPVLKGFPGSEKLNIEIEEKVEKYADEVRSAAIELEGREGFIASLNSSYQYFYNKNLASLWINFDNYTGGAHGLYWMDSYTINTETGQVYTFPQVFAEGKGVDYITEQILKEVEKSNMNYFESAKETIINYDGNYNFLINGDIITVYFPLYDIAPYVAGIQSFDFPSGELEGLLRAEILEAIRGQEVQHIPFLDR